MTKLNTNIIQSITNPLLDLCRENQHQENQDAPAAGGRSHLFVGAGDRFVDPPSIRAEVAARTSVSSTDSASDEGSVRHEGDLLKAGHHYQRKKFWQMMEEVHRKRDQCPQVSSGAYIDREGHDQKRHPKIKRKKNNWLTLLYDRNYYK